MIREELKVRQDVYTYDALAWVFYKNKQYSEAQHATEQALKMDTPEPSFYYHTGMIALALGRKPEAAKALTRALELNPKFDPIQAPIAKQKLAETTASSK